MEENSMTPEQKLRAICGFGIFECQILLIACILLYFFNKFDIKLGSISVLGMFVFLIFRFLTMLSVKTINFIFEDFPKTKKLLSRLSITFGLFLQIVTILVTMGNLMSNLH